MFWKHFHLLVVVVVATRLLTVQCRVKLKADVIYIQNGNITSALFRCSAGKGHMYYLHNIITWSKIGRDGKERFLSLNWDLVDEGKKADYGISSQVHTEKSNGNVRASPEMYFVLGKQELTPEDHGEFICRLYDFDRNVMAEESVPIIVFDEGLALSPYKIEGAVGKDIAINCMQNTSISNNNVRLYHLTKTGSSTNIVENGKIANAKLNKKYKFMTRDNGDRILHNILTLRGSEQSDEGHFVCEVNNDTTGVIRTNASITIGAPKLKVSPLYFLNVPTDAVGHFKCECEILDTAACINNEIVWSLVNTTSGMITDIYKDGTLQNATGIYETDLIQNGSAVNLTIKGLKTYAEGEYVCSLHDKVTRKELARVSLPVTTTPVSLGVLSLIDNYPNIVRFLCTLSGSMWDSHYFEDHIMSWERVNSNGTKELASNGLLSNKLSPRDKTRFEIMFDSRRFYSILDIRSASEEDFGKYKCLVTNKWSGVLLKERWVSMYGKGNSTLFSPMGKAAFL